MPILPRREANPVSSWRFLAVAALVFAGGCGLADYEKRIDEQKEYLQRFDEENELLGQPLEMPTRTVKDDKGLRLETPLPLEFFLRPPKGIANKFKAEDPPFVYEGLPVVRYEGPKGYNVLATTAPVTPEKGKAVAKGSLRVKEFQQRTRGALADYFQKQSGRVMPWLSPDFEKTKPDTRVFPNPRGKSTQITFDTQTLAEHVDKKAGALFYLYFTSTPFQQGAIIFQVPAEVSDNAVLKRAIQLSVNTYALGVDATKKRADFRRTRKL